MMQIKMSRQSSALLRGNCTLSEVLLNRELPAAGRRVREGTLKVLKARRNPKESPKNHSRLSMDVDQIRSESNESSRCRQTFLKLPDPHQNRAAASQASGPIGIAWKFGIWFFADFSKIRDCCGCQYEIAMPILKERQNDDAQVDPR